MADDGVISFVIAGINVYTLVDFVIYAKKKRFSCQSSDCRGGDFEIKIVTGISPGVEVKFTGECGEVIIFKELSPGELHTLQNKFVSIKKLVDRFKNRLGNER